MNKKKIFLGLKILITIGSGIGTVIIKSNIDWKHIFNNYFDIPLCKEIGYDLCVGIFSAMILVWFIDEINERIQEKDNKNTEREKIKRTDRILQQYIERYRLFFYCVVTPMGQRDFEKVEMPLKFSLKDMCELYQISLLISEGALGSSIESFIRAEKQLREEIEYMLRSIEFNYYPQIRDCLLEFVEASLKYNQKEVWLEAKRIKLANETEAEMVQRILKTEADVWYDEIKTGKNEYASNIIHSYFALYEMLNAERDVILKYEEEIRNL